ncbi:MAG TPA: creatininase family protein [Longimicrobiales bacterium]|nr:creatininase family protein [Longimicrobiales bacterium]
MALWDRTEIRLEHLTSPEVGEALEAGYTTVVFACGAVEQHGPAIALSMDAEHGTALAHAVARRLGNALVGPTLRIGCSEHHMGFAGTLTLREETFRAVVTDVVESLSRHGVRRIVILPTHGGNFAPLAALVPELDAYPGTHVEAFTDLFRVMEVWQREAAVDGLAERVGGHADVAEASIMMAFHPDRVRPDRAEPGRVGPLDPEVSRRLFEEGMKAVSPNGVLGDARGMNPGLGRRLVEALADAVVEGFGGGEPPPGG